VKYNKINRAESIKKPPGRACHPSEKPTIPVFLICQKHFAEH
jgi:hypothetical protein